eukprot:gene21189-27451_t
MAMRNDPKLSTMFHCSFGHGPCTRKQSITEGTFFGNSRLTVNKILLLAFFGQLVVHMLFFSNRLSIRLEGQGVERTEDRRMFAISVDNRNKVTLTRFIKRYVRTGSHIITDCWNGYDTSELIKLGMQHSTVNHSKGFKDPTNSIEGNWRGFKQQTPTQHYNSLYFNGGLDEVIWRRNNVVNGKPL